MDRCGLIDSNFQKSKKHAPFRLSWLMSCCSINGKNMFIVKKNFTDFDGIELKYHEAPHPSRR
jgi:hypothetical protein